MDVIAKLFNEAKKKYDANKDCSGDIVQIALTCIEKLNNATTEQWDGPGGKEYTIFVDDANRSRPFLSKYKMSCDEFVREWSALEAAAVVADRRYALEEERISKIIYNVVVPFCVCFDIWKSKSRKTPGTFFEVVLGTLISKILPPNIARTKHVPLPPESIVEVSEVVNVMAGSGTVGLVDQPQKELYLGQEGAPMSLDTDVEPTESDEASSDMSSVATDIVFEYNGKGVVIPAKITTRERIVQPFAHQKILDGVFGVGRYISLLICVSETQRSDKDRRINEICVPGTITLFQKHLAQLGGIYYLDPPQRYLALNAKNIVAVRSLGFLFAGGLAAILRPLETARPER